MKLKFYEVVNNQGKWMANYAPEIESFCGVSAFVMARITAIQTNGSIYSVNEEGERNLIWPK